MNDTIRVAILLFSLTVTYILLRFAGGSNLEHTNRKLWFKLVVVMVVFFAVSCLFALKLILGVI